MSRFMIKPGLFTLILTLAVIGSVVGQDANEILSKMDGVMFAAKDKQAEMRISIRDKSGSGRVREAVLFQKDNNKRLTKYTKPDTQAGIATLVLPNGEMWLYLPALGGPKKLSILAKSQAFNNTDFSLEDMANSTYGDRYTPTLLAVNSDNYLLELIPKDIKSSYSKVVLTVNKANFYPEKMEYYDRVGNKFKEATYKYNKEGEYWNASEVVMTNLKKDHSTRIEIFNVKYDQGLDDALFEVENLRLPKEERKKEGGEI